MSWNEIVSSICICCSAIVFSCSLQCQKKVKMLFVQMFASSLYLASFLFVICKDVATIVGAITAAFEIIRLVVLFLLERNEKFNTRKNKLCAMILYCVALTVCSIFAWAGWISLLPLAGAILISLVLCFKNILLIKFVYIVQAAMITTYLLLLSLWINAGSQAVTFVFAVVGFVSTVCKKNEEKQK